MARVDQGISRASAMRANYEASLGNITSAIRRGGISQVLKTLGINKAEPSVHVNVGKQQSSSKDSVGKAEGRSGLVADGERSAQRTLGVSLLGACSSKGCPTKSVENEDRYVHGKVHVDMSKLQGLGVQAGSDGHGSGKGKVPCWAFATFDGHAGPACAHYLKENFMAHLRKTVDTRCNSAKAKTTHSTATRKIQGNADAGAGKLKQEEEEASQPPRKDGSVGQGDGDGNDNADVPPRKPSPSVEVVLARLLTDTLASLTREFEEEALEIGEISGACVISGLYCEGALVLANVGDCQAVYHGQVKSAPGDAVTAQTTVHDGTNPAEVNRFLMAGGYMSASGRFQGVLEPSRTVGDVDVKADCPKGCIASFPELFKVDIASDVFQGDEKPSVPPFLVLATDGIWDETSANIVVDEVKDGIAKIQAHKRRFAIRTRGGGKHKRNLSFGSTTFTDGESDSEDEPSEFCGSGEWAEQGMDLAERVVSLARGRYDDATALVVVFE
ncbi:unnamed protein product [Ectocarpus sp. 12 AP-2014]